MRKTVLCVVTTTKEMKIRIEQTNIYDIIQKKNINGPKLNFVYEWTKLTI